MKDSIKKNTVYNMVKTCASVVFPLVTFPYASRVLLPDGIGFVNFGLSIVSYFSLIATLGITTHAVRECAVYRGDRDKLSVVSSEIFSINILTTLAAYALLFAVLLLCRQLDSYRELIVLQSSTILFTTIGCEWLNTAMEDFRFITLRTVGFQALALVLLFTFVHTPDDCMTYAAISVVASAGANIMNVWYRRKYCAIRFTVKMRLRYHFVPILTLFAMMLAQTVLNNVDMTMLGLLLDNREVGLYSTAYKISNLVSQVVFSLFWVVLPQLTRCFEEGRYEDANRLLRKALGFNVTLGLPLAVIIFMIADDAVTAFAGLDYVDAGLILRLLMLSFVVNLFGGSFLGNAIMLPSKGERHFMVACIIAAVANIILNIVFIPMLGAVGAAMATIASSVIILLYLIPWVDKRVHIERIARIIWSPVLGCCLIVLVCSACSLISNMWIRLASCVAFSGCIYFAVMVIVKNEFAEEIVSAARNAIIGLFPVDKSR